MLSNLPPFLANSTLPQWISAFASSGLFIGVLTFVLKWRGQSIGSDAALREDMANELEAMRRRDDERAASFMKLESHWREMLEASDRRHDECEEARRELRRELDKMHDEIRGLRVQIREASTDRVILLEGNGHGNGHKPSDIAPHAAASAPRVKRITRKARKADD
jgi:hypothetical protein